MMNGNQLVNGWIMAAMTAIALTFAGTAGESPKAADATPPASAQEDALPPSVRPEPQKKPARSKKADWWWDERFSQKKEQIANANGKIDLVFLGDSITHNWEKNGQKSLKNLEKTYSVLDIGYSGDRTENMLWRCMNGELDGYEAKCVMLMAGTNNTWHRNDKPEDIAAGIRKILDLIAAKQPNATTLLLPIFPFGASPDDPKRLNNEKVNAIIKDFADGKKVIWVDFNSKFLDEKGDNVAFMPDHCHPNSKGYALWMEAVLPYFQKIVGK